jgi:hypothetical protein
MPHRTASLLKASPEGEGSHPPQKETLLTNYDGLLVRDKG